MQSIRIRIIFICFKKIKRENSYKVPGDANFRKFWVVMLSTFYICDKILQISRVIPKIASSHAKRLVPKNPEWSENSESIWKFLEWPLKFGMAMLSFFHQKIPNAHAEKNFQENRGGITKTPSCHAGWLFQKIRSDPKILSGLKIPSGIDSFPSDPKTFEWPCSVTF